MLGSQKDLNAETTKDPQKEYSIYVDQNEDTTNLYKAVYRKQSQVHEQIIHMDPCYDKKQKRQVTMVHKIR